MAAIVWMTDHIMFVSSHWPCAPGFLDGSNYYFYEATYFSSRFSLCVDEFLACLEYYTIVIYEAVREIIVQYVTICRYYAFPLNFFIITFNSSGDFFKG